MLSVASVIGRDFAVDVLQRVGGISEDALMSALEEAMRVSLIEDMKGGREARFRFTHAFFRQTLYEEMIAPRRLRMHNEVAKALEEHYAGHVEDHAAELAEHYAHSSSEDDLHKAVKYGEMAATRAASVWAFSEAARLLQQAIEVQEIAEHLTALPPFAPRIIETTGVARRRGRPIFEKNCGRCKSFQVVSSVFKAYQVCARRFKNGGGAAKT